MDDLGKVYLVGAGPGDPDLLTVKAAKTLKLADVVVYDRLVSEDILDLIPATAARLSVGKEPNRHPIPQEEINRLLVRLACGGLIVIRLKGGDPFVFGRGGEEAMALSAAGVPFEIVPGITAAQGCAASTKTPLTHRGMAASVRYVTGHCKENEPLDLDWAGLADAETTLVVYMGVGQIRHIATRLIAHGLDAGTPVLAVANGTREDERQLRSTLAEMPDALSAAALSSPTTFIIGRVAAIDFQESAVTRPHLQLVDLDREAAIA